MATGKFKKDLKIMIKRGYNLKLLDDIVTKLANGEQLPVKNKDHNLSGNYVGKRECHITPDWLLIYEINDGILVLMLYRVGSHSELF